MQQQNFLMLPDAVKQEPTSPNYTIASTSTTPPPLKRYTPSPNPLNPTTISPNMQTQGVLPSFDMMGNYAPSISPLQNVNTLNQQQYQAQINQNQFNIPNANIVNAAVNFLNNNNNTNQSNQMEQRNIGDILTNHNMNLNQLDNVPNTHNDNVLDSGMNISSLLNLGKC